jgi:hypothetical protein
MNCAGRLRRRLLNEVDVSAPIFPFRHDHATFAPQRSANTRAPASFAKKYQHEAVEALSVAHQR